MRSIVRLTAMCCVCLWFLPACAADLKITVESTSFGHTSATTTYVKGQRSRHEWRSASGRSLTPGGPVVWSYGPPHATIDQCDAGRVYELDLQAREYTTYRLNEQGLPEGWKPAPVKWKSSGGTLTITIETIDTGERRQMFGHTARHIITKDKRVAGPGACSKSGESEQDGWYIDLDATAGCPRLPKSHGPGVAVLSTPDCMDKLEIRRSSVERSGYPLELTMRTRTTSPDGRPSAATVYTAKVTELSEAPLDLALFDVPAGFKRVLQLRGETRYPLRTRLYLAWQWLKDDLAALFR